MARIVQLFLPLVCAVFAESQLDHMPYFDMPRLQHASSKLDINEQKQTLDKLETDFNHHPWFRHFMEPRHPGLSDGAMHSYDSHRQESYEDYNPFFFEGINPYVGNPYLDPTSSITFPGMSNAINMPDKGLNSDNHLSTQGDIKNKEKQPTKNSNSDVKAKNKPSDVPLTDKQQTSIDKNHKSSDVNKPSIPKNPEELPPKTNELKKNDTLENKGPKNDKNVDINKKKDYLLVGPGNNGNNIYLLHENKPNPTTVPISNTNQPVTNNVVYVPYYPGQSNNPVPQVNNGQPTNLQVSPNKINVNGYNNGVTNTPQPINTGNQNPGYILVYSNGQLIQVPGVVVNTPQNNLPIQSNSVQPTNYIIANAVPNNVPATQNSGSNIIYATLPNQGANSPIYIQIPNNCNQGMPNNICSGTVVQNPNNGLVSNYINQPNQNMAQPAILLTNGGSNGYAQQAILPQAMNAVSVPQGAMYNYQNTQPQPAVQIPINAGSNQYNQPIPLSQGSNVAVNTPNNGAANNQNNKLEPVDQIPADTESYRDNNTPNQVAIPAHQEDKGNNDLPTHAKDVQGPDAIVNKTSLDKVAHPDIDIRNAVPSVPSKDTVALDDNSMIALGAQPAIMISGFKETTGDKKDKKNDKAKKAKKDKSKKKDKKNKDSGESKEQEPLTNKKK